MSESDLDAIREPGETWRDAVARIAAKHGHRDDCLGTYDEYVRDGTGEPYAAVAALGDFDVLAKEWGPE